ncbi:class D beta-lactamase [Azospirillum sp.]|uniref:class D beta-lactamase n=1 Tax=Azospirillum sp. TaxID=34012 RepID=UPI002D2BDD70|nr:class D beta-lactamase [Azospirillum sp.]HYD70240.1 class D beta-lactamase [Azospirillum sp.]
MIDRRQFTGGLLLAGGLGAFAGKGFAATTDTSPVVCTHVRDLATGRALFRDGPCDRRFSPMSTFKFPLALMGFDSGILKDTHDPRWDYRPEYASRMEQQKIATDPTIWLRESIVWYSQELTRRMGMERFKAYVDALDYGNRDVRGNLGRNDGLTESWLMSSLTISTDEQVQLLSRVFARTLPVSGHACDMTLANMPSFPADGGWTVWGKTGSGWLRDAKGAVDRTRPLGWFIGWAEKDGRRVVFARLEAGDPQTKGFGGPAARAAVLAKLSSMIGKA